MNNFTAIDFETGNSQRASACEIGYAVVENGCITLTGAHLIKPIGGHAPFQTKIHGITASQTKNEPTFDKLFPQIKGIFKNTIIGHSQFDKQVLKALSDYYNLGICFDYIDSCVIAKERYQD